MTEQPSQTNDLQQQQPQVVERFRFCDLSHPVMQQLVNFQLKSKPPVQHDFD